METIISPADFKGLTNDDFLRQAQLFTIASNFLQDAQKAHPTDLLAYFNTKSSKKYSQSQLDDIMAVINSGQIITALKQEADARGISDLPKAIGQLNYQANYQDALNALMNKQKADIKTVIMKYVLPTLFFAGLAYLGYIGYVKYIAPAIAAKRGTTSVA